MLLNLRSIQLTAMTYGYDLRTPFEMMLLLTFFMLQHYQKHFKTGLGQFINRSKII
ncbi:hypothetical protein KHA80_16210 [Anaerobacillus sp. HL2]|nr:hypothetical protein KHA80_16210 [Anaerobacillus sp. HL2]